MDEISGVTHQLEYLFLRQIIAGLRNESISIEQARELAQEFLTLEPFVSADDAQEKSRKFVEAHEAFSEMQKYMDTYIKEKDVNKKVAVMQQHIKQNNIDAALQVAKE